MDGSTAAPAAKNVVERMIDVMAEVGVIGKNRKAPGLNYAFRGIDDIMPVIQPLLVKHGVLMTPEVIEREREAVLSKGGSGMISVRVLVRHTFEAPDGSTKIATTLGEALDSMDKATNKAMTAALKAALTTSFAIPTHDPEADTEASPQVELAHPKAASKPKAAPAPAVAPDAVEKEKATLRALFETSATVAELDATWARVKALPNPDIAELTPVFKARKNILAQQAAK
jgi:hypothetical protein